MILSFFCLCLFLPQPLPEKQSMRLDRFAPEFLAARRRALHKFLERISEHPVLSFNENLQVFVTAKAWVNSYCFNFLINVTASVSCGLTVDFSSPWDLLAWKSCGKVLSFDFSFEIVCIKRNCCIYDVVHSSTPPFIHVHVRMISFL